MSLETQCHLGCLVVNLVAGKYSSGYQHEIERLLSHNGLEWVTNRLKACWNAALHLKGGRPDLARAVYQQNSISYHKGNLLPKGPVGPVVKGFLDSTRPSALRRWAAVLRFYTGLTLKECSWKQFQKSYSSINSPSPVPRSQMESLSKRIVEEVCQAIEVHPFKRLPIAYADKLRGTAKYYSPRRVPYPMKSYPYSSMALSLITTSWVPPSLEDRTPCKEMRQHLRNEGVNDDYVGKISFLQESGCKARVVAQPTAWLQLAFAPLQSALQHFYQRYFPLESCVEDQEKGVYGALESIALHQSPVSVDLSSATDRLPRFLQTHLLTLLGLEDFAVALDEVCSRPFKGLWKGQEVPFYYRVGQPMGLYGSFPLLNISNLFIGRYSELHAGLSRDEIGRTFKVLGDDIIFLNDKVAAIYTDVMQQLGVEVSPVKCRSGRVAEFAGFVVLPTSQGSTAFRPYKVPPRSRLVNPMEFLHAMGIKVRRLSPAWERRYRAYALVAGQLSPCLNPILPEDQDRPLSSTYRADNRWVMTLTNELSSLMEDLPDLSGNTKINTLPLFLEQGPFDFYGFNPEKYKESDVSFSRALKLPGVPVYSSVEKHPVVGPVVKELSLQDQIHRLEIEFSEETSIKKRLDIGKRLQKLRDSVSDRPERRTRIIDVSR